MTRTERSQSLRALAKDRSGSRNGMDMSVPKGGAGAHNWGSLDSETRYEDQALDDEAADTEDQFKETGCERSHTAVLPVFACLYCVIPFSQLPNPPKRSPPPFVARAVSPTRTVRMPSRFVRTHSRATTVVCTLTPYNTIRIVLTYSQQLTWPQSRALPSPSRVHPQRTVP